jgi:hypothetical protein
MCFGSVFIFVKEKEEEDTSWVEHNRFNGRRHCWELIFKCNDFMCASTFVGVIEFVLYIV